MITMKRSGVMGNIYENYCVAFIDILGFKMKTNTKENIERNSKIITQALDLMRTYKPQKEYERLYKQSNIIQMQVSDSLIFIFPKDFCNIIVATRWISILQFLLARKGIYIRGSINSGVMYIDQENDIYFGEAWNKAVLAEAKAGAPRILLEPSIARIIGESLQQINESVAEFFVDNDGEIVLTSYTPILVLSIFQGDLTTNLRTAYTELLDNLEVEVINAKKEPNLLHKFLWISQHITIFGERFGEDADDITIRIQTIKKRIIEYLTDGVSLEKVHQEY